MTGLRQTLCIGTPHGNVTAEGSTAALLWLQKAGTGQREAEVLFHDPREGAAVRRDLLNPGPPLDAQPDAQLREPENLRNREVMDELVNALADKLQMHWSVRARDLAHEVHDALGDSGASINIKAPDFQGCARAAVSRLLSEVIFDAMLTAKTGPVWMRG